MMVGEVVVPVQMEGASEGRQRDPDETGSFDRRWSDRLPPQPPPPHPVKDIVLPLVVVIALIGNALMVGISWGRLGQRLDTNDERDAKQESRIEKAEDNILGLKEKVRDLSRDGEEDRKNFLMLEDYTRGRIDGLPYHPPPSIRR